MNKEEKVVGIDYERECEYLQRRLEETMKELEQYKKALLNICTKI